MDLRDLEVFTVVAEELHFGRAAERVHLSQPSVTRIIKSLESELEVELLDRSRRSVELTPAGLAFAQHARELRAAAERGILTTRRVARGEQEPLVLGISDPLTTLAAREGFERFCRARPERWLELRRVKTIEQLSCLRGQRCDAIVSTTPVLHPELHDRLIEDESLVAVLPREHPLARRDLLRIEEVIAHPHVSFYEAAEPLLHRRIEQECCRLGISSRPERVGFRVEDLTSMLVLVSTGVAVSVCPSSICALRHDGVVYRPLVPKIVVPKIVVPIYVVWWGESPRPRLASFLESLPGSLAAGGLWGQRAPLSGGRAGGAGGGERRFPGRSSGPAGLTGQSRAQGDEGADTPPNTSNADLGARMSARGRALMLR